MEPGPGPESGVAVGRRAVQPRPRTHGPVPAGHRLPRLCRRPAADFREIPGLVLLELQDRNHPGLVLPRMRQPRLAAGQFQLDRHTLRRMAWSAAIPITRLIRTEDLMGIAGSTHPTALET